MIATSLAAHAPAGRRIRYIILLDGEIDAVAERLASFDHGGVSVEVRPTENPLARFPLLNGLPPAALLRLMLPELLPEFERVLYIDGDVLVRDDISLLFDMDIGDSLVAMARDLPVLLMKHWGVFEAGRFRGTMQDYFSDILGLDPSEGPQAYANSGVILMKLDGLRGFGLVQKAEDMLERLRTELIYGDQCVINAILAGRICMLDMRWNLMAACFSYAYARRADAASRTRCAQAARTPGIIHFTGSRKPWLLPREETILAPRFAGQWWTYARHAPEGLALRQGYVRQRWWLPKRAPTPVPAPRFLGEAHAIGRRLEALGLARSF